MENPEKIADTSSDSPSIGGSQTGEIVLAKFEALTSQSAASSHGAGEHLDEQVLGYLEVQPSDLHVVQDNNTIYLQPQEIEIDGQHLILTQGDEAGEIIVVVSTDHENPSEQTVAELAQGAMVNAGVMAADSGDKTHTLVVSSTQSAPHIEVIDNNTVGTSGTLDDSSKKHAHIVIEETPFGHVSTSHSKANDKANDLFRTLDQKACHVERTVKIVTSTGIHWSVPEEKPLDRKEMKAEMLFIPASSTVAQSSGIPASVLLSPASEEGKDRRLMQLACIAQELQSKSQHRDDVSHLTKELDIEEPSTSQCITRQTDMVDTVTSAGNLEECEMSAVYAKNNEGVSSTSLVSESQKSNVRKPTDSANSTHLNTMSEVSSSNQLPESGDISSINSQLAHSTSATLVLPSEVDSTISEKVHCSEDMPIKDMNKKTASSITGGIKHVSDERLCERAIEANSHSQVSRNDTASSSFSLKESEITNQTTLCAKAASTPSYEDSANIITSVSSSSSQSPSKSEKNLGEIQINTSKKKKSSKVNIEQFDETPTEDSVQVVTSFTTPHGMGERTYSADGNSAADESTDLSILTCKFSKKDIEVKDSHQIETDFEDDDIIFVDSNFPGSEKLPGDTLNIGSTKLETSGNNERKNKSSLITVPCVDDNVEAVVPDDAIKSIFPDTLTDRDGKITGVAEDKSVENNERKYNDSPKKISENIIFHEETDTAKHESQDVANLLFHSNGADFSTVSDGATSSMFLPETEATQRRHILSTQCESVKEPSSSVLYPETSSTLNELSSYTGKKHFQGKAKVRQDLKSVSSFGDKCLPSTSSDQEETSNAQIPDVFMIDILDQSSKHNENVHISPDFAGDSIDSSQVRYLNKTVEENTARASHIEKEHNVAHEETATSVTCVKKSPDKGLEMGEQKRFSGRFQSASSKKQSDEVTVIYKRLASKKPSKDRSAIDYDSIYSFEEIDSDSEPEILKEVEHENTSVPTNVQETMPVIHPIVSEHYESKTRKLQHSSPLVTETKINLAGDNSSCLGIAKNIPATSSSENPLKPVSHATPKPIKGGVKQIILNPVKCVPPLQAKVGTRTSSPTIIRITPECKKHEAVQQAQDSACGNIQILLNDKQAENYAECSIIPSQNETLPLDSDGGLLIMDDNAKEYLLPENQEEFQVMASSQDINISTGERNDSRSAVFEETSMNSDVLDKLQSMQQENHSEDDVDDASKQIKTITSKPSSEKEVTSETSQTKRRQRKAATAVKESTYIETRTRRGKKLQEDGTHEQKNSDRTTSVPNSPHDKNQGEEIPLKSKSESDVRENVSEIPKRRESKRKVSKENTSHEKIQDGKGDEIVSDDISQKKDNKLVLNENNPNNSSSDFETLEKVDEMTKRRESKRKRLSESALDSYEKKKGKVDTVQPSITDEKGLNLATEIVDFPEKANLELHRDKDISDAEITESHTKKRSLEDISLDNLASKKPKNSSCDAENKANPVSVPVNLGTSEKDGVRTEGIQIQKQTELTPPSKRGKSRGNISQTSRGRRHIHSSAAFDALRKQSKVLSSPPKFSRAYFKLKHARAHSVPLPQTETPLVPAARSQISPLKHCDIRIRCQTPSSPEKPNNSYQCVNCRYSTSRVENLIQHYKEKCLYDTSDIFEWGIEDMDRRQRIRGEEPKENGCALDLKQLAYQNNSKTYVGVGGTMKLSDCAEQSGSMAVDSDSDSESFLAESCQAKNKFGFIEGDVVWVDWRRLHWPALVRRINHKEKRVSVMFIDTPTNKNGIKVSVKRIQSFNNAERNKKYLSEGRATTFGESLVKAVQKAEDFLRKRCLGISVSAAQFFESFDDLDYLSDVGSSASSPSETGRATQEQRLLEVSSNHGSPLLNPEESHSKDDVIPKDVIANSTSNEASVKRKQRRDQNAKLLQCIKDGKVETHLLGVYRNTISSDRHSKFNSSLDSERNQLKHQLWFGPIDDEEQQEEIYEYCLQLFKSNFEYGETFDVVAYVFEVWVPEAIVKAISRLQRVTMTEAEELFARGVQWSKSEVEDPDKEISTEEDQQEYREKMILRMRDAGVVEEINQALAM